MNLYGYNEHIVMAVPLEFVITEFDCISFLTNSFTKSQIQ